MTKPGVGREGWPEARWPKPRGGQEPHVAKEPIAKRVARGRLAFSYEDFYSW